MICGLLRFSSLVSVTLLLIVAKGAMAAEIQVFPKSKDQPAMVWSLSVGEIDAKPDEVDGISVDPFGNTVISGVFRGALVLGNTTLKSRGQGDIFLASISPKGRYRWVRHFGSTGDDNTFDLTTDGKGNIIASGWFSGKVDFGGVVLKSNGKVDQFIAKFNPAGEIIWAKAFGGADGDGGNEVCVLDNGEIVVSGITEGDVTIEGVNLVNGGGGRDSYVIRLKPDGSVKWVRAVNGPGAERIRAVSMDDSGNVYLGFQYHGTLRIESKTLKSRGGWDGAVAKLTPSGALAWLAPVGSVTTDNTRGIGVDHDGNVYASGVIGKDAFVIDKTVSTPKDQGADYIVKLSPRGDPLWFLTITGRKINRGGELQVDQHGVMVSFLADCPLEVRRNLKPGITVKPTSKNPTSCLAAFDRDGSPRFFYMPRAVGSGTGALGDVLSISRDGKYIAQAIRYRKSITIGETVFSTPSMKDSAVIFFTFSGHDE